MVLSGGSVPSISTQTWERITNAARELGYTPNRFAQARRTNRTMMIACLVPDITNPFYPTLMRGIQSVTDGLNYDVIAINTDGTPERERHFLDWSQQGRVDGVIGVFFTLRAKDFKPLIDAGVDIFDCSQRRFWEPEFGASDMNFAGWVKKLSGRPTVTVGSITLSQEFLTTAVKGVGAEVVGLGRLIEMLERGDFDLVAVGRAILVDPNWVEKVRRGALDELLPYTPEAMRTLS